MSQQEPDGPYVYQPRANLATYQGRLWGVGGLPIGTVCEGFTREEAASIVAALNGAPAPAAHQERTEPTTFEDWWARVGMFLDPDTEDVSWFDKRKELCQYAFAAAMAQSRNYVADREVCPREITFTNGRKVVFNDAWRCLDVVEAKRG